MRFTASFLLIIVTFLSIESAIPLVKNTMAECCEGSCHKDQQSSTNGSPYKTIPGQCNPFLGCGSCTGFTLESSPVGSKDLEFQIKLFTIDQQQFSLFVSSDFWHPPKLI